MHLGVISWFLMIKSGGAVGGPFSFRGFRFLLFLTSVGPPSTLDGVWFDGEDVGKSQLNYHNRRIDEFCGKYKSQIVEINWPATAS